MAISLIGSANGVPASTASYAVLMPAGSPQVGDRYVLVVMGKYNTTTVPTISSGWTLVGSGTGGTGSPGNDAGQVFWAVFVHEVVSTPVAQPTITAGATAPNSWLTVNYLWRTSTTWRDTVTADAPWVLAASDTGLASPLAVTPSSTLTLETGDALMCVGGIPSDTGTAADGTNYVTRPGLSGGTKTYSYVETALGQDMGVLPARWVGFTGPSTDPAYNIGFGSGGTNHSGVMVVIELRESQAEGGGTSFAAFGIPL
jgi:hypothetical protein